MMTVGPANRRMLICLAIAFAALAINSSEGLDMQYFQCSILRLHFMLLNQQYYSNVCQN
jgi:hypothetical protein